MPSILCKIADTNGVLEQEEHSIRIINCNEEYCRQDKIPVNGTRLSSYALHFVCYGKGTLDIGDGNPIPLERGDMFLLYKSESYKYVQDNKSPWAYLWIEFDGTNVEDLFGACGFTKEKPYINCKQQHDNIFIVMRNMVDSYVQGISSDLKRMSGFFQLIAKLIEMNNYKNNVKNQNLKARQSFGNAIVYIRNNYRMLLDLPSLSQALVLSESYLKHLFPDIIGMTVTEYINKYRVSIACAMIKQNNKITNIQLAKECGFSEETYFMKTFKKYKGITPKEYKTDCENDNPFLWLKEKGISFD